MSDINKQTYGDTTAFEFFYVYIILYWSTEVHQTGILAMYGFKLSHKEVNCKGVGSIHIAVQYLCILQYTGDACIPTFHVCFACVTHIRYIFYFNVILL